MAALDQGIANKILNSMLTAAAWTAVPGVKVRLTTTAGTSTAAGTELSGTGYTAGGAAVTFATSTVGSSASSSTVSWTNTSGGSWTLVAVEVWDTSGTPVRLAFGTLTGQPITVPNGATFQITSGNLTLTLG